MHLRFLAQLAMPRFLVTTLLAMGCMSSLWAQESTATASETIEWIQSNKDWFAFTKKCERLGAAQMLSVQSIKLDGANLVIRSGKSYLGRDWPVTYATETRIPLKLVTGEIKVTTATGESICDEKTVLRIVSKPDTIEELTTEYHRVKETLDGKSVSKPYYLDDLHKRLDAGLGIKGSVSVCELPIKSEHALRVANALNHLAKLNGGAKAEPF